jgi:hypothetical protein
MPDDVVPAASPKEIRRSRFLEQYEIRNTAEPGTRSKDYSTRLDRWSSFQHELDLRDVSNTASSVKYVGIVVR